jgi:hypothetical protein
LTTTPAEDYFLEGQLALVGDISQLLAFAQVKLGEQLANIWAVLSADTSALETADSDSGQVAAWFASPSFTADLNFIERDLYQLMLELLNWYNTSRSDQLDALDAVTGQMLGTQMVSGSGNG